MGTLTWAGAAEQPPDEITRSMFGRGRRIVRTHPLATDALLAAVLLALCSAWLAEPARGRPARGRRRHGGGQVESGRHSGTLAAVPVCHLVAALFVGLTVLIAVARRLSNTEIAASLFVSEAP